MNESTTEANKDELVLEDTQIKLLLKEFKIKLEKFNIKTLTENILYFSAAKLNAYNKIKAIIVLLDTLVKHYEESLNSELTLENMELLKKRITEIETIINSRDKGKGAGLLIIDYIKDNNVIQLLNHRIDRDITTTKEKQLQQQISEVAMESRIQFKKKLMDRVVVDPPLTQPGGKKSKKLPKKEILGKMRCIYKIPGDRKEYLKHKGKLITVKEYKELIKTKSKKKEAKPKKKEVKPKKVKKTKSKK